MSEEIKAMKYDQSFLASLRKGLGEAYIYLNPFIACEPKLSPYEAEAELVAEDIINSILKAQSLPLATKEIGYKRSFYRCAAINAAAVIKICEIEEVESVIPPLFVQAC